MVTDPYPVDPVEEWIYATEVCDHRRLSADMITIKDDDYRIGHCIKLSCPNCYRRFKP